MPWINKVAWTSYVKFPLFAYITSYYWCLMSNYFFVFQQFLWRSSGKKVLNTRVKRDKERRKEAFKQGIKGVLRDLLIYSSDWGFEIKKIKVPVYLFYRENDTTVPLGMGKYYASQIKGSKLVFILTRDISFQLPMLKKYSKNCQSN